ncbi:MAG: NAD(P)-dependent oxidoreductase [Candidatus Sungbacteria bacterium]|nr:NAD(P)-dependent oxidoreductase [Candidatus Sungbacteria bacterium]
MSKILITGGAGFVGYHLAKRLADQEHEIVLVDNFSRNGRDADLLTLLQRPNTKLIEGDLTDPASYEKFGTGYDYVYHLAGINGFRQFMDMPHEVLRVGAATALNILDWFRTKNNPPAGGQGAKILFTSSNEVFTGAHEAFGALPVPTPENVPLVIADPYNPRWSYAGSKIISELLFIHYAKVYNLRMVIVRLHNLYGPGAGYDAMIPKFIGRTHNRLDPFPMFGPDDLRASCYIADAVEAMQTAIESSATDGQTYHIGDSREATIKTILETMFEIMQWHPKEFDIKPSPNGPPTGGSTRDILDVSKIKTDIGWEAKTSLEQGLRKTIEWYLAHPAQS